VTAQEVLHWLRGAGAEVRLTDAGHLALRVPSAVLTADMRAAILRRRAALVCLLRLEQRPDGYPKPLRGRPVLQDPTRINQQLTQRLTQVGFRVDIAEWLAPLLAMRLRAAGERLEVLREDGSVFALEPNDDPFTFIVSKIRIGAPRLLLMDDARTTEHTAESKVADELLKHNRDRAAKPNALQSLPR
jgi:hypothetical protein